MIDASVLRRRISDKREGTIGSILGEMEDNIMVLPEFQREYVWNLEKVRKLLTSIIAGRIVGAILTWETTIPVTSRQMTDGEPSKSGGSNFVYLLDGQQRMTSIYHAIKGDVYKKTDFSKLLVDLDAETIEDLIVIEGKEETPKRYVLFKNIFLTDVLDEFDAMENKVIRTLNLIADRILEFNISIFMLKTDNIEDAINQFNALNTGGKNMTIHEIVLSKIYSPQFKLKEEIAKLMKETKNYNLSENIILDTLSFCIKGSPQGSEMIGLEHDEVQSNWKNFSKALKGTTDFLTARGFRKQKELPYKNNFSMVCRLFFDKKLMHLDFNQANNIIRYILFTGITQRYRASTSQGMNVDYVKLHSSLDVAGHPHFQLENVDNRFIHINGDKFNGGNDAFSKSILWMFESETPLSLKNNMAMNFEQPSNSNRYGKNHHHIYPKNYMKRQITKYPVDHLVNICHVESGVNQKEISDKKPSVYLQEFAMKNPQIKETCTSLLFDYDIAVQDDYEKFFEARLNTIRELVESYFPELK